MPAGQVNIRGSLPRSENSDLQPMLHPDQDNSLKMNVVLENCGHLLKARNEN